MAPKRNHALVKTSVVALILALLILAPRVVGQETQKPQQPEDVIRVYTDLVQTDVMVFDKQDRAHEIGKPNDGQLRFVSKSEALVVGSFPILVSGFS